MSVRVFAPAKINLTLRVGAPRPDGMHPLESAVAFADAGDWVEASPGATLSLEIRGAFAHGLGAGEDNLVIRAARALAAHAGVSGAGAHLVLEKNLPVASGIGGGSADAAAALKALNRLWGLGLPEAELMRIAAALGADVPVCVRARSAWMTGTGDVIGDLYVPPLFAVLANPLKPLPTGPVFKEFDRRANSARLGRTPPDWRSVADVITYIAAEGNDLAAPARGLMPEIGVIEAALSADPRVRYAGVSGSGATVFALVGTSEHASALQSDLSLSHPEWWVRAAKLAAAP